MKLLSGNPDGFAFVFEFQRTVNKGNRLTIYPELCEQPEHGYARSSFLVFTPLAVLYPIFANLQKAVFSPSQSCKTVFYGLSVFCLSCCNKSFIC